MSCGDCEEAVGNEHLSMVYMGKTRAWFGSCGRVVEVLEKVGMLRI